MAPQYKILNYNCFSFFDLSMSDYYMFDFEKKSGKDLYNFYKKYFLKDYDNFIKIYDINYNTSFINKLINKRNNFPEDSKDRISIDYLVSNTKPLLRHQGMKKEADYISNFLDNNKKLIIDDNIYRLIKFAFHQYESDLLKFLNYNKKENIKHKIENF